MRTYTKKQIEESLSFWRKKLQMMNEDVDMSMTSDIMTSLNNSYDISAALDSFAENIESNLEKTGVEVDEVVFSIDDSFSDPKLILSYVVKCYFQPPESQTRWNPGTGGYFEDVYPKLAIELLQKMFNDAGLSLALSEECAKGNSSAKDAMKSGESFDEFFTEYLTDNFFNKEYKEASENCGFSRDKNGIKTMAFVADVTFDVKVNDFASFGKFLLPYEKKQDANESEGQRKSIVKNVQICLVDGMWKVQDLDTGKFLFGGGNFLSVFEEMKKEFPKATAYANVDGEEVIVFMP